MSGSLFNIPSAQSNQTRKIYRWKLRKLSRVARVQIGFAGSAAAAATGLSIEVGVGWGLMAGGVVGALSFLFLAETDEVRRR